MRWRHCQGWRCAVCFLGCAEVGQLSSAPPAIANPAWLEPSQQQITTDHSDCSLKGSACSWWLWTLSVQASQPPHVWLQRAMFSPAVEQHPNSAWPAQARVQVRQAAADILRPSLPYRRCCAWKTTGWSACQTTLESYTVSSNLTCPPTACANCRPAWAA